MKDCIARAICSSILRKAAACGLGLGGYGGKPGGRCGCGYTDELRRATEAVLAAMREPTEAMIKASREKGEEGPYPETQMAGEYHWQAMIDAALAEK